MSEKNNSRFSLSIEPIQKFLQTANKIIEEVAASRFPSDAKEIILAGQELERQTKVAEKLAEAQFVCWEYLPVDFTNAILGSGDLYCLDKLLDEHFFNENHITIYEIADLCLKHERIDKYRNDFNQCMTAFDYGLRKLMAIGLCTIIDALLSDVSGNFGIGIKFRKEKIEHQIDECISKVEKALEGTKYYYDPNFDDINMIVFLKTFEESIKNFDAFDSFSHDESHFLNRNRLVHGRSSKDITDLDCQKILRILYGILILDDYNKAYQEYDNEDYGDLKTVKGDEK